MKEQAFNKIHCGGIDVLSALQGQDAGTPTLGPQETKVPLSPLRRGAHDGRQGKGGRPAAEARLGRIGREAFNDPSRGHKRVGTRSVAVLRSARGSLLAIAGGGNEYPRGTLFFWNSAEYVKTGEVESQLAGNGPFFITREGEVFHLPTHEPWEKSLSKLGLDKARGQASIFDI